MAGRFRLEGELGQGGMASVWAAQHVSLDAPCAVKFIDAEGAQSSDMVARFQREARAAAKLRSRHVVQILDYGVWRRRPFIAMELMEGESLADRLERVGRLSVAEVLTIAEGVCSALTLARRSEVIHRDLKPENMFLVGEAGHTYAKVLDFGIAKIHESSRAVKRTESGILLGTPFYMSPEHIDGTLPIDYRSDLWAVAVIIYECLIGELPFDSPAFGSLALKIMKGPVPIPSQRMAELPQAFDDWWLRAVARDPEQRFQSAEVFLEALQEALSGVELARSRSSRISLVGDEERPAQPTRSYDAKALDGSPAVQRASASGTFKTFNGVGPASLAAPAPVPAQRSPAPAVPSSPAPDPEMASERRMSESGVIVVPVQSRRGLWIALAAAMVALLAAIGWFASSPSSAQQPTAAPTTASAALPAPVPSGESSVNSAAAGAVAPTATAASAPAANTATPGAASPTPRKTSAPATPPPPVVAVPSSTLRTPAPRPTTTVPRAPRPEPIVDPGY